MFTFEFNFFSVELGGQRGGFSPDDVPGLIGWYDAQESSSLVLDGSNRVTQINNRVSGGLPLRALGTNGTVAPLYQATNTVANNNPALLWEDAQECGIELYRPDTMLPVDADVSELFMVCAYKDGLDSAFDGFTRIIGTTTSATITQGEPGTSAIRTTSILQRASLNGAAFSPTLLPLPLSVVRFSASNQGLIDFIVSSFGQSGTSGLSLSWKGPICEVLAYTSGTSLTTGEVDSIEGYLANKWGIT